jgi:hypothetical protein
MSPGVLCPRCGAPIHVYVGFVDTWITYSEEGGYRLTNNGRCDKCLTKLEYKWKLEGMAKVT